MEYEEVDNDGHINAIDLSISEAGDIIDVLAFIHVEAEPVARQRLNDAMVQLLYIASERLQKASARLADLKAAA